MSRCAEQFYAERFEIPSVEVDKVLGAVCDERLMQIHSFRSGSESEQLVQRIMQPLTRSLPYVGRIALSTDELVAAAERLGIDEGAHMSYDIAGRNSRSRELTTVQDLVRNNVLPEKLRSGRIRQVHVEPVLPEELPERTRSTLDGPKKYKTLAGALGKLGSYHRVTAVVPSYGADIKHYSAYSIWPYALDAHERGRGRYGIERRTGQLLFRVIGARIAN